MTESELQDLESLANAATPGPWRETEVGCVLTDANVSERYNQVASVMPICNKGGHCYQDGTTRFIAHARADIPALIAEVRRLKLVVHQQELTVLCAVLLVAEVERLREIEAIVRRMVHDDLTVQHPGTDTVRRLKELLKEAEK